MDNKLPVAIIPIWFFYMLASGSILEKYSLLAGSIMLVVGCVMAGYIYLSNKSGLKQSWATVNMPLHDIVFKHYIPFLFRHWKIVLICMLFAPSVFIIMAANDF